MKGQVLEMEGCEQLKFDVCVCWVTGN